MVIPCITLVGVVVVNTLSYYTTPNNIFIYYYKDFTCVIPAVCYTICMIKLNLKLKHVAQYKRIEDQLLIKYHIGLLTWNEVVTILDNWLRKNGY